MEVDAPRGALQGEVVVAFSVRLAKTLDLIPARLRLNP